MEHNVSKELQEVDKTVERLKMGAASLEYLTQSGEFRYSGDCSGANMLFKMILNDISLVSEAIEKYRQSITLEENNKNG
jgi:hypothetical protein